MEIVDAWNKNSVQFFMFKTKNVRCNWWWQRKLFEMKFFCDSKKEIIINQFQSQSSILINIVIFWLETLQEVAWIIYTQNRHKFFLTPIISDWATLSNEENDPCSAQTIINQLTKPLQGAQVLDEFLGDVLAPICVQNLVEVRAPWWSWVSI